MKQKHGLSIAMIIALLLGVLSIATIAVAYYFIDKSRNNSFENNMVILNKLQQLDAKWNESILKTRRYSLQDFDQLAQYMTKIRQNLKSLEQQGMSDSKKVGQTTAKQYQIYKHSFATKNEAIERYKSEQAILRNSVRYLPEAGDIIQQTLSKRLSEKARKLTELLSASKILVNQYLLGIITAEKVKEKLQVLEQQTPTADTKIKNKIKDYLTHLHLILKHKPKVEEMLQTSMSVDIATQSSQLVDQYSHSQDTIKQSIKHWQQIMLAGVLLLFALFLWFLLNLRKSASKILLAKTEHKAIQQQLVASEEHIKKVDTKILEIEQRAASGQLSLNTFRQINVDIPALAEHLSFLNTIKANPALAEHQEKISLLATDINKLHNSIQQLNTLIDPQKNKDQQINFDFNHVIRAAFEAVSSEIGYSSIFNKQLSAVPEIQASPIGVYQIAVKLIQKAAEKGAQGTEKIFIKTWATGHYANLCLGLSGYNDLNDIYADDTLEGLKELVDQNSVVLKLTPREDSGNATLWVSFPYKN